MEIYKKIDGFEAYAVSNIGNVKSLRSGRVLKHDISNINIDGFGYQRVTLSKNGKTTRLSVHRLVADNFVPNPDNKPHVNHIDNDPSNNKDCNLEWCTHSENMIHCVKTGRSTNLLAGLKGAAAKQEHREIFLRNKLGDHFVSYNKSEKSSITYTCAECMKSCTSRVDSSAFARDKALCMSCSRKTKR